MVVTRYWNNIATARVRSVLAQCLAMMSPNMLMIDIAMACSFPTIVVPALLNSNTDIISFNESQASWFGSTLYLTQPLGAVMSGPIIDYFGRKKASLLVNIPHIIAWILLYLAPNVESVFVAVGLLGIGNGLMEAPIYANIAEISEPSLRGALSIASQCFFASGTIGIYFLGIVSYWRNAALISLAAPILSIFFISLIPDSPVWLLSKGREKDALKALCYVRGWTKEDNVRDEFIDLVLYAKNLQRCVLCCEQEKTEHMNENKADCEHRKLNFIQRFFLKFKVIMLSKSTMKPLFLILMYFLFYVMSGLTPIRPNMVNICNAFGMADKGENVTFISGLINLATTLVVVAIIKYTGKRKMCLTSMLGSALACTALCVYAKTYLPSTVFSFDVNTFPVEKSYAPLVFMYLLTIFTGSNLPWVLLGEVFPFRSRGSAQGIAAAWNYIVTFIGTKTYIDLETNFGLSGTFAVYAAFSFIGTIFLYFYLPETEGVSLQDIEKLYAGELTTFANDPFINAVRKCTFCKKKYFNRDA